MSLSINIGRPFLNDKTLDEQARSVLRLYGTDAHVYLPGANGVAVSGLLSNNYTLSDGSTGYSAVDGTAGLVLDAAGAVGAELVTTQFTSLIGYINQTRCTLAIVGDEVELTATDTGVCFVDAPSVAVVVGSTYQVSVLARYSGSAGGVVYFGAAMFSVPYGSPTTSATSVPLSLTPVADNAQILLRMRLDATAIGQKAYFKLGSVKQVTGIHATQATTANKPALRRGLYNVLKQSNTFTEANWLKTNIALTAGVADPFGGTAATTLTATVASGEIYQTAADAGKPYTSGIYIRRRTGSGTVSIRNAANTAWINLSLTSAWQLLVNDGGTTTANWYLDLQISTSGDAVDVYGAIVSPGVLSAAQILSEGGIPITTSAAASNPSAGRYSWQFDGTNDSLALGSVPFTSTDDFVVVAAVRPDVVGSRDAYSHGSTSASNPLMRLGVNASNHPAFFLRDDAGVFADMSYGSVVSAMSIISIWKVGDNKYLRLNGTTVATNTTAIGTATFNSVLIGARAIASPTSQWNGAMGPMLPIKGTFTENDVLTIERLVAANAPNGPVF